MSEALATQTMAASTETGGATSTASVTESASATASQAVEGSLQGAEKTEPSQAEKKDYRQLYREDPEFKSWYDEDVNRRVQKIISKQERKAEREKLMRAVEDPVAAIEYAQSRKQTVDAEDAAESTASEIQTQAKEAVQALVNRPGWTDLYADLYKAEGRAKMDERFFKDPAAFVDWVEEKLLDAMADRRAEERAKKIAPEIAKGLALSEVNEKLKGVPVPLMATGMVSDESLLASVKSMSPAEYRANRERILAAENRRIARMTGRS